MATPFLVILSADHSGCPIYAPSRKPALSLPKGISAARMLYSERYQLTTHNSQFTTLNYA